MGSSIIFFKYLLAPKEQFLTGKCLQRIKKVEKEEPGVFD
jgi:hypothetical protein